jgi:hypothetical protein
MCVCVSIQRGATNALGTLVQTRHSIIKLSLN